jgi:hypothetical protein
MGVVYRLDLSRASVLWKEDDLEVWSHDLLFLNGLHACVGHEVLLLGCVPLLHPSPSHSRLLSLIRSAPPRILIRRAGQQSSFTRSSGIYWSWACSRPRAQRARAS